MRWHWWAVIGLVATQAASAEVRVWPAPAGETLSALFAVKVAGHTAPVHVARVAPSDQALRWKAMDDKANSANYHDTAAYVTFDMRGPTRVEVTCPAPVTSLKALPESAGIKPTARGRVVTMTLNQPVPLTLEVNGETIRSLHVFANPMEADAPKPGDRDVVYFGPGIHQVQKLEIHSGQTLYIAGGAIVRGVVGPTEPFEISGYSGLKTYAPTVSLVGDHIRVRGRGILDGTLAPTHARNLLYVQGSDIEIEGVILHDSSTWNMPIRRSDRVRVSNVKILGSRANSDGIDVCNSRDVTVEKCFIRTLDDLICVKTDAGQGQARNIAVRQCVLWNQVAHALSIGAELREDVDGVTFEDCDVIHDIGREWTLRIYHCDSGRIRNTVFRRIRVAESQRLISLWINKAVWTRDENRGHIDGVTLSDITATGNPLALELLGYDGEHQIENVKLERVTLNGKPLGASDVKTNAFVKGLSVTP